MFRYRSNKQAFIIAALVILLCFICLTGATLALFTSDRNDGTIGIVTTTGEVKIDVIDTDGVTLQGKSLAFMTASGLSNSEDNLFEPGASFYTQGFEIANDGTIPVNFKISISKDERIEAKDFDEVFEIWIVEKDENSQEFVNAKLMSEYKGELGRGEKSRTLHLYIKMKETAGKEFQNKRYEGICITVSAVQGNAYID